MWQEAIEHVVGCWTNDEYEFDGEHWQMPKRRVLPKPMQKPHPPLWGATSSPDGHRQVGELGLGLCSFAVGVPPEQVKAKHRHLPRGRRELHEADRRVRPRRGGDVHDGAVRADARGGVGRTPASRSSGIRSRARASSARWPTGWPRRNEDLGNYAYAADMKQHRRATARSTCSASSTSPSRARACRRDARRLPRSVPALRGGRRRPAALPREPVQDPAREVMQTIELMGTHVIPEFK